MLRITAPPRKGGAVLSFYMGRAQGQSTFATTARAFVDRLDSIAASGELHGYQQMRSIIHDQRPGINIVRQPVMCSHRKERPAFGRSIVNVGSHSQVTRFKDQRPFASRIR
jgi:hypothetical protein